MNKNIILKEYDKKDNYRYLQIFANDILVGKIEYLDNPNNVYINYIKIDDEYRKQGLGTIALDKFRTLITKPIAIYPMPNAKLFWEKYLTNKKYVQTKPNVYVIEPN